LAYIRWQGLLAVLPAESHVAAKPASDHEHTRCHERYIMEIIALRRTVGFANMSEHLHHKLAVLHQTLLHGKLPRSLHWNDAVELIGHLGRVEPHGGDEFAFIVGKQRELFKRPRASELGVEEVSRLRKFLKDAGTEPAAMEQSPPGRMVVAIDHHSAHVYRDLGASRPQEEANIEPYDPHHFHHHLLHRKEAHYQGDRVPEETSFYEEVAAALAPATEIVLIGSGTGKSSAVAVLADYLQKHHANIAQRVRATETADLSALSEPEIEAIAKRHMTPK
jgi:hypothetical protein